MKVSIIMPVYNAETSLPRALASVASQRCRDFELVCVDDCSTDGSYSVLERFARITDLRVRIIRHDINRGVATARNTGVDAAEGDFIAFLDADDILSDDMVEKALAVASQGADVVGWDWYLDMAKNGRYMRQADYLTPLDALKGLMSGLMRWNLWLFLTRKSLWTTNKIKFIDGMNMGEDMMATCKLLCCARKVAQIHKALYHYNSLSSSSISRQFDESNRRQVSANIEEIQNFVESGIYAKELSRYLDWLKLYVKLPLLVSGNKRDYLTWKHWYTEADKSIMANRRQPLRARLLQVAAAKGCWPLVKMYYIVVEKVIYGIIYK